MNLAALGVFDFSTDTDSDLLAYIAMQEDDPETARQAWAAFYARHAEYLYKHVRRGLRDLPTTQDAAEGIVQDAFCRVFAKAGNFELAEGQDSERQLVLVRSWLGRIARNLIADRFRQEKQDLLFSAKRSDSQILDEIELVPSPDGINPEVKRLFEEAWATLSDREQEVLRTTALYLKVGETFQNLPRGVARKLATDLGTSTDNVRTIRMRAKRKIEGYVEKRIGQGAST